MTQQLEPPTAASDLTLGRAREINRAMVDAVLFMQGVTEDRDGLKDLSGYTLREMIDAAGVIKAAEELEHKFLPSGAPRSFAMVCDDRLVAALYCAAHYQARPGEKARVVGISKQTAVLVWSTADVLRHSEEG
jgi:hypothetical protein